MEKTPMFPDNEKLHHQSQKIFADKFNGEIMFSPGEDMIFDQEPGDRKSLEFNHSKLLNTERRLKAPTPQGQFTGSIEQEETEILNKSVEIKRKSSNKQMKMKEPSKLNTTRSQNTLRNSNL